MSDDLKDFSMADLFRIDAEVQLAALTAGLLAVEAGTAGPPQLEAMMRAAHSIKGAARIIGLNPAVQVAHAMEDAFVAAQRGEVELIHPHVDRLLVGVDLLTRIAATPEAEMETWTTTRLGEIDAFLIELKAALAGERDDEDTPTPFPSHSAPPMKGSDSKPARGASVAPFVAAASSPPAATAEARFLRVTADNLNRLLGLASESLVESRWLRPFGASVGRMKRLHAGLARSLERLTRQSQQ